MIKLKGKFIPLFTLSALICCAQANADIVEVIPVEYSFDSATDSGAYNYQDDTGRQLVDGLIHDNNEWHYDVGRGGAYDIVGWGEWRKGVNYPFVSIDFEFDGAVALDYLTFGAFTDHDALIYLPNVNIYAYEDEQWTLKQQYKAEHAPRDTTLSTRDEVSINLDFEAEALRFEAVRIDDIPHRSHNWVFIDEIDFYSSVDESVDGGSSVNVSTPASMAAVLFLFAFGATARRKYQ